ncbi:hypothetical protein DFQ30_004923, partial [Apophysomyces sp. BC1015]
RARLYGRCGVPRAADPRTDDDDDPHRRICRVRRGRSPRRRRADRPDNDQLCRRDADRNAVHIDPVRAHALVSRLRDGGLAVIRREPDPPDQTDSNVCHADCRTDRILRVRRLAVGKRAEQADPRALPATRRGVAARTRPVPRVGGEPSGVLH